MDEGQHSIAQIVLGAKTCPLQTAPAQNGEEDLDLIHPGSMKRCMVELKPAPMPLVEPTPALLWSIQVDVKVVPNHDHFPGPVVMQSDFLHEGYEILRFAGVTAVSEYVAGADVEGGQ